MTVIYIVDTETTGLSGASANEKVVEIAICKIDTKKTIHRLSVEKVFESIVGQELSEADKQAWIFLNSDLTPEMVNNGPSADGVIESVNDLLKDKAVTSFNADFDLTKFLDQKPWVVPYNKRMPCIMLSATEPCAIKKFTRYGDSSYKWPSLEQAYSRLVKNKEPDNGNSHRAMNDCHKSAQVLISLIESNDYNFGN